MEHTSSGIDELKDTAQRQTKATDDLRQEVTLGFGSVNERVSLVEQAHATAETQCVERLETLEAGGGANKKHIAVASGTGFSISLVLRELWEAIMKTGAP